MQNGYKKYHDFRHLSHCISKTITDTVQVYNYVN